MKSTKGKYGRTPIRSLEELSISQIKLDEKIRQYLVSWTPEIPEELRRALEFRASVNMNAANVISRIQFAESLTNNLQSHFVENETQEVFFVTLISELHAVKLEEHTTYDLADHHRFIASILEGCDYVGMIEPAYFPKASFITPQADWLSWHAHLLVWNIDKATLKMLKDKINGSEVAFRPGGAPFNYRKANPTNIEPEVAYFSKSPRSEYSAYRKRDGHDGIAQSKPEVAFGKIVQNKREMRTGQLLRVLSTMSGKSLKSLVAAGREGRKIRELILNSRE